MCKKPQIIDLCTKLYTLSTKMNRFSCGKKAIKIENMFAENSVKQQIRKEKNFSIIEKMVKKFNIKYQKELKNCVDMI